MNNKIKRVNGFDQEFRETAIKLAMVGNKSIATVAKELEMSPKMLYAWVGAWKKNNVTTKPKSPAEEELRKLQKRNKELELENEILKKSGGILCEDPAVKYAFIQRHERKYPITTMCRVLRASRAGYYHWRKGRITQRQVRQDELLARIKKIFKDSRGNYGSPRVLRELRNDGIVVNHKTVEDLMKKNGIQAKRRKKFKATTNSKHNLPIAENLLNQDFNASSPNQAWVGDITYSAPRLG